MALYPQKVSLFIFTGVTISNPILHIWIHGQISRGFKFTYIYGTVAARHVTRTGLIAYFEGYCLFSFDRHIVWWNWMQPANNQFPSTILINSVTFLLNIFFNWTWHSRSSSIAVYREQRSTMFSDTQSPLEQYDYCINTHINSKRFLRWCITHRITGFWGFFHRLVFREHDVSETRSVSVLRWRWGKRHLLRGQRLSSDWD
jgi:hypothetical protein